MINRMAPIMQMIKMTEQVAVDDDMANHARRCVAFCEPLPSPALKKDVN